mmetsp:Transcript_48513/g.143204  ORF Transcript_48513/g.143204 Transcript_48513/m.143204 type:complete len:173 (-) Transcript_48513:200-718(-)
MAEEGQSWDTTLDEWVISEGYCIAAGMAQQADFALYAAAPAADEAGWALIFKEDHEEQILQDDGETTKPMTINEATTLKAVVETGKAPPGGFWLGGEKYTVTQVTEVEVGDHTIKTIFANRPKKGVHIAVTTSQALVGMYDETVEGANGFQTAGNAKKAVLAFAEYLCGLGY